MLFNNSNTVGSESVSIMESQGSDDATQVISQSVYMGLIRSRVESEAQKEDQHGNPKVMASQDNTTHAGNTQFTYDEGDTGFLDLISSLPTPCMMSQLPVPSEISPTHSQMPLTQFPESQRFKTPATAGKKRDYMGNVLEETALPKNPFEGDHHGDMANLFRLSQAFAATQAATSPILALPTSALRSDRPSPQVDTMSELHQPPISSPLRSITGSKRITTEPAVRYVSVDGSQDQIQEDVEADIKALSQADDDEESDNEPTEVKRRRREKLRENQARRQIQRASSHLLPKANRTRNDNDPRQTRSVSPLPANTSSRSLPSGPPQSSNHKVKAKLQATDDRNSNSRNPQAIMASTGLKPPSTSKLKKPSQRNAGTTLVPRTTRKSSSRNQKYSHSGVGDSPLPAGGDHRTILRSTRSPIALPAHMAEEQNLDAVIRSIASRSTERNLSQESIDRIPASPEPPSLQGFPRLPTTADNDFIPFDALRNGANAQMLSRSSNIDSDHHRFNSVVPETSSALVDSDLKKEQLGDQNRKNKSMSFLIGGLSHSSTTSIGSCKNDQADRADPKRKRIGDLSQEIGPLIGTQSSAFDAAEILALDRNPEYAKALASNQDEIDSDPIVPYGRRKIFPAATSPVQHASIETYEMPKDDEMFPSSRRNLRMTIEKRLTSGRQSSSVQSSSPTSQVSHQALQEDLEGSPLNKRTDNSVSKVNAFANAHDSIFKLPTESQLKPQPRTRRSLRGSWEPTAQDMIIGSNQADSPPVKTAKSKTNVPRKNDKVAETLCTPITTVDQIKAPTMIFAYYMNKTRAYYPAVCLGLAEDGQQYKIKWPGYEADNVAGHGICALDIRIGDEVKIDREGFPKTTFIIKGFEVNPENVQDGLTDVYGHTHVQVVPKQRKSLPGKVRSRENSVPVSSLYIDLGMWNRISRRPSLYQQHFKVDEALPCTPIVRTSTPSTASCRSRNFAKDLTTQVTAGKGCFGGMVFALTFETEATKERISRLVQTNGGTVLAESFADLFDHAFKLKPEYFSAGFTALITDRHSRKGKYVQALALGVPCLNSRWVIACVENDSFVHDWQDYLLPAGECTELGGAVRSRNLPPTDATKVKLQDIFGSRKDFFDDACVVFVVGRWKTEKRKEQRNLHLFFVQAMTPTGNVKIVSDLDQAVDHVQKSDEGRKIWLIVADDQRSAAEAQVKEMRQRPAHKVKGSRQRRQNSMDDSPLGQSELEIEVADSEFVLQSLIFGRLCRR